MGTSLSRKYRSKGMENCLRQAVIAQYISNDRPVRDTMSLEEAIVSNMWEIAAIVPVVERKWILPNEK